MNLLRTMVARSPLLGALRARSQRFGRVLMYHRIVDDECDPVVRNEFAGAITRSAFAQQLDYLGRHYQVVSLEEIIERRNRCAGLVALTFDDGYADNLHNALPELARRRLPATIFVSSGFVDKTNGLWLDRLVRKATDGKGDTLRFEDSLGTHDFPYAGSVQKQLKAARTWLLTLSPSERDALTADLPADPRDRFLNADEMRELERGGVKIEAHTVNHPRMSTLDRDAALQEVTESKRVLESLLDSPIRFMAYPYGEKGDFDKVSKEAARAAGYAAAFAAYRGLVHESVDLFAVPRIGTREDFDRFRVRTARYYPPA